MHNISLIEAKEKNVMNKLAALEALVKPVKKSEGLLSLDEQLAMFNKPVERLRVLLERTLPDWLKEKWK